MDTVAYQGLGPAMAQDVVHSEPTRLVDRIGQLFCGWSRDGHQMILGRDRQRLFLVCSRCFHETPGWTVDRR